jgi:hypothetical protein
VRRRATLVLLLCAAWALTPAKAAAAITPAAGAGQSSVLLVLIGAGEQELAGAGLSVGILSATQGPYDQTQFLLDVTQGARVADTAYSHPRPPALAIRPSAGTATVAGWTAARRRAEAAPAQLRPGLLASAIGGAGYVALAATPSLDALLAADARGRIATVSLGERSSLLARIAKVRDARRLVVADLPGGPPGETDLRALVHGREAGELVIALQRAGQDQAGHELLWAGVAGLVGPAGGTGQELTSATTHQRGLISAIDLAPTILAHLGPVTMASGVIGRPIASDGRLSAGALRALMARLHVIEGRRLPALGLLLAAWALLGLIALPRRRWRLRALRSGALGVLWTPAVALVPAALDPSAPAEYAMLVLGCLALGSLTDRLLPWPRAPLAPAVVAVLALTIDALAGTQLLMRSLLGPNPIGGARFYGIGNELKSALAVLVLAAVAAALYPTARGRRAAGIVAAAGALLAVVEGSARIGAGVGGVILVCAGFAWAAAMLLEGALTRRRALVVLASPLVGLVALAAIDLASAHGGGHFTASILHAHSVGDVRDVIARRSDAALDQLGSLPMALASALALCCAFLGVSQRDRLLAAVGGDPGFSAALAGGLLAGVVGALVEDSGPLLLVVAVFTLACVAGYVRARP